MRPKVFLVFFLLSLLIITFFFLLPDKKIVLQQAFASSNVQMPKHGVTSVYTAADLDQAHTYGFEYVLPYYASIGETPTDVTTAYGQALQRNNMKVIIDVTNYGPPNSKPWLYDCGANGKIVPNISFLTNMVNKNKNSPLTLGYWTKDDDYRICADNNMADAMKLVYQTIKTLDPNPNHYVIAGFGGAYSIKANYQPGEVDVIGYYAYRAWNRSDYVCNGAGTDDQIMDCEINQLNSIVQARTPAGQTPPVWIDMYQAYYTNTIEPPDQLKYDIQKSIAGGAVSLIAFAWDKASGVDHIIKNDTGLQNEVRMANDLSKTITGSGNSSPGGGNNNNGGNGTGFVEYPSQYSDYYNFAKNNLFDGIEFFTRSGGTTGTGNNGGSGASGSDMATYAKDLAEAIRPICPAGNTNQNWGYVNGSGACVDNIASNFDSNLPSTSSQRNTVVQWLKDDTINNYNALQCVGFAVAVTKGVGNPLPNRGFDAKGYNSVNISKFPGYTWIGYDSAAATIDILPGDIVTWQNSGAGHIAVVDTVDGNNQGSAFHVYEANGNAGIFGAAGSVGRDIYHFVVSEYAGLQLQGWLRSTKSNSGGGNGGSTGGNIPPSSSDCNSTQYKSDFQKMNKNYNFGDPKCDYQINDLANSLGQLADKNDYACWFNIIAKYESGYDPNAYLKASTSGRGAYGLFQMNPWDKVAYPDPAKQNSYDVGDVYWRLQTDYAIKHYNADNKNFRYWQTANQYDPNHKFCHA